MGLELRCDNGIKHGELEDGVLEVKCRSNRCGHQPGTVIIHRFSVQTGELLDTLKFKDPSTRKETATDASRGDSAVRTA